MDAAEFKAARRTLGLSAERLANLGAEYGRPLARSARTVRRWEDGSLDIPGSVALLLRVLLHCRDARWLCRIGPLDD